MSTFEKVRDIVVDQLGVEADEVSIESTFIDDLGADSLDIVELIMAFEEEFGIEIPDEAAEYRNIRAELDINGYYYTDVEFPMADFEAIMSSIVIK